MSGLEIELGAQLLLLVFALAQLAFAGHLLRTLRTTLLLAVAPFAKKRVAPASGAALTSMRLGPAIAMAASTSVAWAHLSGWLPWLL